MEVIPKRPRKLTISVTSCGRFMPYYSWYDWVATLGRFVEMLFAKCTVGGRCGLQ